jgi:hypothetical protein
MSKQLDATEVLVRHSPSNKSPVFFLHSNFHSKTPLSDTEHGCDSD